jgi:hypothetical protein
MLSINASCYKRTNGAFKQGREIFTLPTAGPAVPKLPAEGMNQSPWPQAHELYDK